MVPLWRILKSDKFLSDRLSQCQLRTKKNEICTAQTKKYPEKLSAQQVTVASSDQLATGVCDNSYR